MKKRFILLTLLSAMFVFVGCTTNSTTVPNTETTTATQTEDASIMEDTTLVGNTQKATPQNKGVDINVKVEKDNDMYKIIIAPDFFGINESDEDIKNEVRHWGASTVQIDPQSKFVTVTMTEDSYNKYVLGLKNEIDKCINELQTNKEKYPSIIEVKTNAEYNQFDVYCKNTIKTEKTISALDIYLDSASYQVFSGVPQNEASVTINYIDNETKELIETIDTSQLIGD